VPISRPSHSRHLNLKPASSNSRSEPSEMATALQSQVTQKHRRYRTKTQNEKLSEEYRRQIRTLLRKISRMATKFDTEIFLLARRKGKLKIFTSSKDLIWPPGIKDMIVSL
jgi:hypothetical protein